MTNADIARQRLINQGIADAQFDQPEDVVRWLVASQAQDFAGAKWALGLRMRSATDKIVEQAFNAGRILRTHLMRPTWHFVTPEDFRWLLALTAPRVHALNAAYYRQQGLDQAPFTRSNDVIALALQGGRQLTRNELREALRQASIPADGTLRMSYIMMRAELDGLICSGPRRGKQFTYMLLDERAPHDRSLDRETALAELAGRYFASRGPATVQDFAKWSGLTVTDARHGLNLVQSQLVQEEIDGITYWLPPSVPSAESAPADAHLLSVYDEFISSYKDHGVIASEDFGDKLFAMGNALYYVLWVDGQITGTWKRTLKKDRIEIELNPFRSLSEVEIEAVTAAAERYGEFLEKDVVITRV